jgi:hypothetical protein
LHPNRLRCDRCGAGFAVTVPADTHPGEVARLKEEGAGGLFPALAPELRLDGSLCPRAWFADHETPERMGAPR